MCRLQIHCYINSNSNTGTIVGLHLYLIRNNWYAFVFQSSRTTEDNDPHSHADLPPFVPEATDENSKFIGIKTERENAFGDIEDPKADLKRDHPTRKVKNLTFPKIY